jgi:hypothetical protein
MLLYYMATYNPPTETLPIFDSSVFTNGNDLLSTAEGDARYLRFPSSQGSETINGDLSVSGALTAGTFAPSTIVCNTINGTAVGTAVNLYDETTRTGTVNFNTGGSAKNMNIGGTSTSTTFAGTSVIMPVLQVNGQATFQGNTQFGDAAGDNIVPNGTLTKPLIIGTYSTTSSYSTTSTTPVITYLGGTLKSSSSISNLATGTFVYPMAGINPYDAFGAVSLTAGTYMFWMGINWEDSAAFDMTDIRMGLSNVGTLNGSSVEADFKAAIPNYTCYFHKTDSATAAVNDSENRVLSSIFTLSTTTAMYPFFVCNTSVTVDTVSVSVFFVKIGSA